VRQRNSIRWFTIILLLAASLSTAAAVRAAQPLFSLAPSTEVTAFDLILAMNTLRVSNGLPPLIEDPIINAVAQATAKTMADNLMSWHIGNVSGRLAAAGYGGSATVWATENFAVGNLSIDEIMVIWSDAAHMIPAVNPAYCHVGAGTARAPNGRTYYVLQAAYTSASSCGEYQPPDGDTDDDTGSGWIVPVKVSTPDSEGLVYHEVEAGQSLWAIAIAYQVTIQDLEIWNNLSRDMTLQVGQTLFIPGPNTEGYHTPTPVGMIQMGTPDPDGKIVHVVQEYQTLTTIAQAYGVDIQRILALNGIQVDWPLRIGQKLVINPSSATPSPTSHPIGQLTPASDGKYYHTVQLNETLSWIASLYEVSVSDLIAWNGLSESSILQPDQRLLLQVTPPATDTPTPTPVTPTLTPTMEPSTPSPIRTPTQTAIGQDADAELSAANGNTMVIWTVAIGLLLGGSFLAVIIFRRKRQKTHLETPAQNGDERQ
jgi:LysM repeat protein